MWFDQCIEIQPFLFVPAFHVLTSILQCQCGFTNQLAVFKDFGIFGISGVDQFVTGFLSRLVSCGLISY
jgi:hypothetical protein